ncbi:MAG: hypothetical protein DCC65_14920 [Planctomycetota bacterium]|nr:MAG: hypothetical protein DCC65_14920 [Planctomycetota bacterium]
MSKVLLPRLRAALAIAVSIIGFTVEGLHADLRLQSGTVTLEKSDSSQAAEKVSQLAQGRAAGSHIVVQFDAPVSIEDRTKLEANGLRLLDYLADNAYFAATDASRLNAAEIGQVRSLRSVAQIEVEWKLHPLINQGVVPTWAAVTPIPTPEEGRKEAPSAKELEAARNPVVGAYVRFHSDVDLYTQGVHLARQYGANVRDYLRTVNGLVIELPFETISALAAEDSVQWIEPALPKLSECNAENRTITGADIVQAAPYNLSGSGVAVLVYDGGTGFSTHQDFGGRHTNGDTDSVSDHATHVAGTVGGSGVASGGVEKGMAPGVTIWGYGFEYDGSGTFLYTNPGDIEADYGEAINVHGCDISNNSIGTNTEPNGFPCSYQGDYGLTSMVIDSIVRGSLGAPFRVVWANGNERQGSRCDVEGYGDYYSTAPPAGSKNHIAVGALNANDDSMTSFSSWGPVDDGRIKPDVSGPGCENGGDGGVRSCASSGTTAYSVKCGTSMSSPTVCGLSALLLQDYRAQYPGNPDFHNATLKMFLAHTAVDLGNPGPDYQFGYGSVRIQPAIDFMRSGNFLEGSLSQGESLNVLVAVNPGDSGLRVTLAWDDFPATPNANPVLVNDLDLVVFDPSNNQRFPWTLNPLSPSSPAVQTQVDRVNNVEQVFVANPPPGVYRVEVRGFNVPQGPQTFSLGASPILLNCSSQGVIAMDRNKYACAATVTLRVIDCDLNTDDNVVETVSVNVASSSEPGGETVLLTESGAETATFLGTIDIATADAAGVLLVANGDTVTAAYLDADDGIGGINVLVTDTATVDCAPPVISNVQTTAIAARNATITFTTNEPATGTIRYGLTCGALGSTQSSGGSNLSHSITLNGLQDNTTYHFAVDAVDEAGNAATDDNGGPCYSFTTPEVPEQFTELFDGGDNDLDNVSLTFIPNGSNDFYAACATPIIAFPTDPTGGTVLSLSDDGNANVSLTGGAQVWIYGTAYSNFYVNSNGNITFGSSDGDYTESLAEHFGKPRVAALWDDLNPSVGGQVSWRQLGDRVAVTWLNVPEHSTSNQNSFQIELYFDGTIHISYLSIAAADGLAGLSAGTGLSPDFFESDLSALGDCGPRPPSVSGSSVTCPEDTEITITLNATDDGTPNPLSFIIVSLPTYELRDAANDHVIAPGDLPYTLGANGNQVKYLPSGGYFGPDSFQFKANDGGTPPDGGVSIVATVSITVEPTLSLPFLDDFPTTTFDSLKWSLVDNATIDSGGINPPSAPYAARFNGNPDGSDEIRTHLINLQGAGAVRLRYGWQIKGSGESPDAGDDLFVEYLDGNGTWQVLRQHLGSGPDMTTFTIEELFLPPPALHAGFRLRFRNTATSGAFDDWFVDNVTLESANAPTAQDDSVYTAENHLTYVTFSASDPNMDPLTYRIMTLPANGTLRDPNGANILSAPYELLGGGNIVRYTPDMGYAGPDSFEFLASDGVHDSNIASISVTVGGAQPVHVFNFDTDPGWTTMGQWAFGQPTGGGTHNFDPSSGFTGQNVYGYNLNGDYPNSLSPVQYLTTTPLDCSTLSGGTLRFRRWLGIESSTYDHANLQISTNGVNWTTLWDHSGASISESAWSLQTFDISAIADGKPTVYLRWGMGTTDGSVTYPGWNIDDVEILGMVPGICAGGIYGDVDGDGTVNSLDMGRFNMVLLNPGGVTAQERCAADVHADGIIDFVDMGEFTELLLQN